MISTSPKVLITGGSGSIGLLLCNFLIEQGFDVSVLSRRRSKKAKFKTYLWNYREDFIEEEALNCDYIIHLAGAGIADKRWSDKRKKELIESRIGTSKLLYDKLRLHKNHVKAVISASGAGYYGQISTDKTFQETDPPGSDFIGNICKEWEAAVNKIQTLNIRVVNMRIGMVLMKNAGALEKMTPAFQAGLGTVLASGKQFMPWVHIKDLLSIFFLALTNKEMHGPYNCCSPEATDNRAFSKTLAKSLHKKIWLPNTPAWLLKLILGQRAVLLTQGSKLSVQKLLRTGYVFNYPRLEDALNQILD